MSTTDPRTAIRESDRALYVQLEPAIFSKLEVFADILHLTIDQALRQLIDIALCDQAKKLRSRQALSPRQKAVLEHLQAGLSVKEIAQELGVKEDTVRTHIHRVRRILGCSDLLSLRFL